MAKRKLKCPVEGCDWQGKILYGKNGHVTRKHPEYIKPDNAPAPTVTPAELPEPETPKPEVIEAPSVASVAEEVKPEPELVKDEVKAKPNFGTGKVLMIIGGLVLIGVSLFTGNAWLANYSNYGLGIFTAFAFIGGAGLIYLSFNKKGGNYARPSLRAGVKKYKGDANSMIIFAKPDPENKGKFKPWKIEFDYLKNPPGLKRKLRNDGKYYSVNICKGENYTVGKDGSVQGLEDLTLPDTAYCDPRLLKDAVEMRYSREYYTPDPSLLQKMKPVLFLIIVGAGAFILMIVGGPPAA